MNDMTKARYYLKTRQSDLQHLTTFGLMLATAEAAYREVRLRQQGNKEWVNLQDKEVEISLDYAVLRYLKRYNRLPGNIHEAFKPGVTVEEKQELAMAWISA
jgi:hypothetical protein